MTGSQSSPSSNLLCLVSQTIVIKPDKHKDSSVQERGGEGVRGNVGVEQANGRRVIQGVMVAGWREVESGGCEGVISGTKLRKACR